MAFRRNDRGRGRRDEGPRRNERIRIPKVMVVDDEGTQLGVLDTRTALGMARERGLDLVEVAPNADPPVCKFMDYGKFLYQQKKRAQEAKRNQTVIQIKEVKFRPKTDDHDYGTKLKHIRRFLEGGDRCKVTVFFRGREIVHKDRGLMVLERVQQDTEDIAKIESRPTSEGRTMTMMLAPVKR
ncbi:translation initiation factor IF-3 [Salidesulfovibrio brasiliensis]|uniref:translation initiation factor IF-3 n=1 Tax=Salidesulfovibrio brasiliensis TaxID=221711 RepID=UPI0009F9D194|nr:translation initiation factor IF-3 [Salidesulfovibrio brasiliensis]